eukprot:1952415-Pyramimonas_sp.AAC.1
MGPEKHCHPSLARGNVVCIAKPPGAARGTDPTGEMFGTLPGASSSNREGSRWGPVPQRYKLVLATVSAQRTMRGGG